MAVSHPGRLQNLDVLIGAVALIVLSSDHTVVGPDRKQEAVHSNQQTNFWKQKL